MLLTSGAHSPACREAARDPSSHVAFHPEMHELIEQYKKTGENGEFKSSSHYDRSRGHRFNMPTVGLKGIIGAEVFMTWMMMHLQI